MRNQQALEAASPEAVAEIVRQGEAFLRDTGQFAMAADNRATTMAGIFGAGAVALVAAAATLVASSGTDSQLWKAALVTAFFLFVASLCSAFAARPRNFFTSGYEPERLAVASSEHIAMMRFIAFDIQARIHANRAALENATNLLNVASILAFLALPIGVAFYFTDLADLCPS